MQSINFHTYVNRDNNASCIVSVFPKTFPRMTNFISRKIRHNIHHLYLYSALRAPFPKLKNISLANEVTEVV